MKYFTEYNNLYYENKEHLDGYVLDLVIQGNGDNPIVIRLIYEIKSDQRLIDVRYFYKSKDNDEIFYRSPYGIKIRHYKKHKTWILDVLKKMFWMFDKIDTDILPMENIQLSEITNEDNQFWSSE